LQQQQRGGAYSQKSLKSARRDGNIAAVNSNSNTSPHERRGDLFKRNRKEVDSDEEEEDDDDSSFASTSSISSSTKHTSSSLRKSPYKTEFITLWSLTFPIWITYLMEFSISGITVVVTGHLGTTELNAAAIGSLLINTTTIAPIIFGLTAALDTLATQAYTSSNPKMTSLYVQRTAVLIAAALVPCLVLLSFGERIFLLLRQEEEVARLAGQYVRGEFNVERTRSPKKKNRKWKRENMRTEKNTLGWSILLNDADALLSLPFSTAETLKPTKTKQYSWLEYLS